MALTAAQTEQLNRDLAEAANAVSRARYALFHAAQIRVDGGVSADSNDASDRASLLTIENRIRGVLGLGSNGA